MSKTKANQRLSKTVFDGTAWPAGPVYAAANSDNHIVDQAEDAKIEGG